MVSKVVTKHAAQLCEPPRLTSFAKINTLSDNEVSIAEHYLVRTWVSAHSKSQATTINQLRHHSYLDGNCLVQLAPTSSVIRGYIIHSLYVIRNALNLLNMGCYAPNPEDYGWDNDNTALLPHTFLQPLPLIYLSCVNLLRSVTHVAANADQRIWHV